MHGYNTRLSSEGEDAAGHLFAGARNFSLISGDDRPHGLRRRARKTSSDGDEPCRADARRDGEIGSLRPGTIADVSVLADERRALGAARQRGDRGHGRAHACARCSACAAGRRIDADAPILPMAQAA